MGLEAAVEATVQFLNKAVKPVLVGYSFLLKKDNAIIGQPDYWEWPGIWLYYDEGVLV
jgi:hypothetical protein